jgi:FkbH-like protein
MEAKIQEPIRLVIWDLDETFWRGTLSEGGVTEYVEAHHQLVIDLAHCGIMSSICSRNDFDEVRKILVEKGIWDYFIFPSIDWSAKPARVRAIVEATQLRPQTVLFIDDNPSNRAAVALELAAIGVAAETFIAEIAGSPLFKGKPDAQLTRLKQYKLLEKRNDEQKLAADPKDFLRASGIRVEIEADLEPHLERIVELINRTNQLNFTKKRLSSDMPTAVKQLKDWLTSQSPWMTAGIVRVRDNYGDYGYCGFYALVETRLEHFCFSCRVLGFGVESWIYAMLGFPKIEVSGEVLVDLKNAHKVNWISVQQRGETTPQAQSETQSAPPMRLRGRCEIGLLARYFRFAGVKLIREDTYREGGLELFSDSAVNMYFTSGARWESAGSALRELGFAGYPGCRIFDAASPAQPILFFSHRDLLNRPFLYRHKISDFVVCLALTDFQGDLVMSDFADIAAHVRAREPAAERADAEIARLAHLRASYTSISPGGEEALELTRRSLRGILADLPADIVLMPILMHPKARDTKGVIWNFKQIQDSRDALTQTLGGDPRVEFLDISDCIRSTDEIVDTFHYDRVVYHRLAMLAIDRRQARLAGEASKAA